MRARLNKKPFNVLMDSGAGVSLIDYGSLDQLSSATSMKIPEDVCVNASGDEMDIIGVVNIVVEIANLKPITHEFRVLNSKTYSNVLLGRDFMKLFETVTFDFKLNRVRLGKQWVSGVNVNSVDKVRVKEKTTIPARSEAVMTVRCEKSLSSLTVDFDPGKLIGMKGVFISRARVSPNIHGEFQISVLNVTESDIVFANRKLVGNVHSADETLFAVDEKPCGIPTPTTIEVQYGKNLSSFEKKKLQQLIDENKDLFAADSKNPKRTNLMQHRIITDDALPVKAKGRRVPVAWEDYVNEQIQEMLRNGIIRPSSSPWNAPIILVKKKDGSMRFVCDYRGLNDVTKKDCYPLPHIRDILDKMQDAKYWTTLDCAAAYWSMPLHEDDKEKTAFKVPRGSYEFNVTPYGLTNAGASYQRMMDVCLAGLPSDRILCYMDDIVVFSRTLDEHVRDLSSVFDRLREGNITLKASKCVIGSNEVDFLGYRLSENGVKPQERLVTAIKDFEIPKSRKEVKRFLGMAGFYRTFIRKFADIAAPLNNLTRDNVVFKWTDECTQAFRELKACLISEPVLAFPRLGEVFVVEVDASDVGFGGVLTQEGRDSQYHPVAYFSDAVKSSQHHWAPGTKEAFALVLAVRHWYVYLAGTQFVLNSDHNPLVYLRKQKDPRGNIGRWITELEEYDYTVKYITGAKNVKADFLSRNESSSSSSQPPSQLEEKIYSVFEESENFYEQLKFEQNNDPVISKAKSDVMKGEKLLAGRLKRVQSQLRIENDLLTKSGRPVLPSSLRQLVTERLHGGTAHFGTDKTYALLKERFYWPNMYQYVSNFVTSCHTCQQTKPDTCPPKAPLVPMVIPERPMQFVSLDIAYMPPDHDGFKYILLIGDIFSKYMAVVPLRDQTAESINKGFMDHWLYFHGTPPYALSDQASNVDGDTMQQFCEKFGIKKRRSSPYHSQGNGMAERNIRSVREMLRATLLDRRLPQHRWRKLLPGLVFALNCSESAAIKCTLYNVVFGRSAVLPADIFFHNPNVSAQRDAISPKDYAEEAHDVMKRTWDVVIKHLRLSKEKMAQKYNKNVRYNDLQPGDKVWLKARYVKSGESRKLAPKRDGPWTVLRKLPNNVNFEIKNDQSSKTSIVHHDRLKPVRGSGTSQVPAEDYYSSSSSDSTDSPHSDYSEEEEESEDDSSSEAEPDDTSPVRRYPRRERRQRVVPGGIPWDSIQLQIEPVGGRGKCNSV